MDFYLYLPSNTGDFVDNTLSKFRVKLPNKIDLEEDWEVALVEIAYPITWLNIGSEEEGLASAQFIDPLEYRQRTVPYNNYSSIDGLCDAINFTLDNMRSFAGERVNFSFQYDHIRHRVGLKPLSAVDKPNVNFLRLSPQLQYMLGFKGKELELTTGRIVAVFNDSKEAVTGSIQLNRIKWSTRSDEEDIEMIQELNNVLVSLNNSEGTSTGCRVRYFPAKAEIVLESEKSSIVSVNVSESIQYRLGLTDNIIYPNVRYKVKKEVI